MGKSGERLRAMVAGGSLGGLFAGLALLRMGCDVELFERSSGPLQDRGAGLVLQGETLRFLEKSGAARREDVSVPSLTTYHLARDGSVEREEHGTQLLTSWGVLYRSLRDAFPKERYHMGKRLVGIEQDRDCVTVRFEDGSKATADLLVCSDGAGSNCRRILLPDIAPSYAGYVAWRGLVPEGLLSPADAALFAERFVFFHGEHTQILCYLIPGPDGELEAGRRRFNWVWYWNVPEGVALRDLMTDRDGRPRTFIVPQGLVRRELVERQLSTARGVLPDPFVRLVAATAEPFIQPIYDLSVPRMAFGRVCLTGDAAFVPRPHTAASTSKAATDAEELAAQLVWHEGDVPAALRAWEPGQLKLGAHVGRRGIVLGLRSQG